jgi:hypothetical protein
MAQKPGRTLPGFCVSIGYPLFLHTNLFGRRPSPTAMEKGLFFVESRACTASGK